MAQRHQPAADRPTFEVGFEQDHAVGERLGRVEHREALIDAADRQRHEIDDEADDDEPEMHRDHRRPRPKADAEANIASARPSTALLSSGTGACLLPGSNRSEEHTSELQSLMRNSYAVFCLKKKN